MRSFGLITALFWCLVWNSAHGQSRFAQLENNHQIWLDAAPTFEISDRLTYVGNIGIRVLVTDLEWTRIYHRPSVKYFLNKTWSLRGGLGWIYEDAEEAGNRFELRSSQGIQADWPRIGGLRFVHLLRAEQRVNRLFEDQLTEFELRMRMRVGLRWRSLQFGDGNSIVVPASIEWYIPVTEAVQELFSDRTRITVGVAFQDGDFVQIRFTANWQSSKIGFEEDLLVDDWIYRIIAIFSIGRSDVDKVE